MFSKFDEEAQKVLLMAKKEMTDLCHPYVGSEHLMLSILHNTNLQVTKILKDYGITYDIYRNEIIRVIGVGKSTNTWFLYTPLLKRIIENAIYDSKDNNDIVTVDKLFISLLEEGEGVANRILLGMNIDIDLLYDKFSGNYLRCRRNRKMLIDDFAIDLNQKYKDDGFDPVIGRDEEVNRIIEVLLRRTKNNPLLIGEAGVGKTALVEELVRRIVNGDVPKKLENCRVLSLAMGSLVAGTKYRGEFEERINKIISELEKDDSIIIFIDEIHTLVGAGGAEGAIDAANILKPYLARGKIRVIGATTRNEYSKYFEKERALDRRFQKIYIEEPSPIEVKEILTKTKSIYEKFHGVIISDSIIDLIVELSIKYINQGHLPDKAIDILDEACCKATITDSENDRKLRTLLGKVNKLKELKNEAIVNHNYKLASELKTKQEKIENEFNLLNISSNTLVSIKEITVDNVYDVIYDKTKIPIRDILNWDSKKIYNHLAKVIFGQKKAIQEILEIIAKVKKNAPLSLFLVGNSGVGKTFFVKEYAKLLYPKEAFIKIDMSEYKEKHAISKIIGSPPGYVGYDDNNFVITRVKRNPYCVILLDEIEKAHPDVIRLFLQVFDDGKMTSSNGEVVDFSHAIIFMTSNIGTSQSSIGFSCNNDIHIRNKLKEFLGIEFVNRLDGVIYFNDIDDKVITKIIKSRLGKVPDIDLSPEIVEKIKNESQFSMYGVRKLDKILNNYVKESSIYNR
ncbi:MAG: ATP-dependent Clp protease ATP-binding subunit [bacterium]|nr:ATP-dependent Clp protease ATP-binding subunit [bacterium]